MSAINIQTTSAYAVSIFPQAVSRHSFSNVLKNISKVAASIFFLYGIMNLVAANEEITTDTNIITSTEMSNEHCKQLCMRFLQGQGTDVMDHCFLFCDETFLN